MTTGPKKDLAHSIRQKLQNIAQTTGRPFEEIFQYFVMERFLYRLSRSRYAEQFVLKGALMFTAWRAAQFRPTRDIDLLGQAGNQPAEIAEVFREVCQSESEPDGLRFDADSLKAQVIKEDADYEGVRVTFLVYLEKSRFAMQIDIGFGDVTTPAPTFADYPTLLDLPAPRLKGYSKETVIAEKFEAMTKLGMLNSRMKDYFDIWSLSRQFDFEGALLSQAMAATFRHRGTEILALPTALTEQFAKDPVKQTQWLAFVRKARLPSTVGELPLVVEALANFLLPLAGALSRGKNFEGRWTAPGPWS
jgi:predicted nucleotidyltransferase component of viral defense system